MSTGRRRHHQEQEAEPENSERWLLTYADMITLLLALFIVLFAASTISAKKLLALELGFRQSFDPKPGVLQSSNGVLQHISAVPESGPNDSSQNPSLTTNNLVLSPTATSTTTTTAATSAGNAAGAGNSANSGNGQLTSAQLHQLEGLQSQVEAVLGQKGLTSNVSTTITTQGLVIQILADQVYYETDSASLGTTGDNVVDAIASVVSPVPNYIEVEGYTDNQPITGGPYPTNMALSAARAVNVVVRLYQNDGIAESRLSAVGYGETRPAVPNDSPADMAMNRRIDVVIEANGS